MSTEGKLYRVNAYAVSKACSFRLSNTIQVERNGWLWVRHRLVLKGSPKSDNVYKYKAVATGKEANWRDDEVERVK